MKTNKSFTRLIKFFFKVIAVLFPLFVPAFCRAMPPGTLLYRTTDDGKMYGYSGDPLIEAPGGIIKGINPGHVAMYVGKENGVDYVVEALAGGIVKLPAKYFVNLDQGEEFLGALVPEAADALDRAKAVAIAKSLAEMKLAYDFDFKKQKGPGSGEWTCVGLTEKVYESAALANPNNLMTLEYDPNKYAVDITPDGFDNYSFINKEGDCFSREYEFSKISRREDLLLPAPELVGFNAGLEYEGERYIFLPYTQFLQPTLKEVAVDIDIASSFSGEEIRGKAKSAGIILRWSLINNPLSSLKIAVKEAKDSVSAVVSRISQKLFGDDPESGIVFGGDDLAKADANTKTKTTAAAGVAKEKNGLKIIVNKAGPTVGRGASGSWGEETESESENKESEGALKKTSSGSLESTDSKNSAKSTLTIKEAIAALYNPPGIKEALAAVAETAEVEKKEAFEEEAGLAANEIYPASGSTGGGSSYQENIVWPEILINRIYATGDNDWVELYNPTDSDFDLAAAGYRLERTKTAEDPSLVMRIGNAADGTYPGGTIIKAKSYYLIVRDEASDYYRNQADAIATRDEFSWTGSGYTLYLGLGAISSSGDSDLIDAVGYGADATYFQGNGPAPEISDNYVLSRSSQYGNNSLDFSLILSDDPAVLAALAAAEIENEEAGEEEGEAGDNAGEEGETGGEEEGIEDEGNNVEESGEENQGTEEEANIETESGTETEEATDDGTGSGSEAETGAEIESETGSEAEAEAEAEAPLALISKIYATGNDDWIELYNPTDFDFDLAASGYRLEKTKTAVDPSLIMRIGDAADGTYPGGTIIKAKDYYLIVRDEASDYYLSRADAIATRDEFSWTVSGYTLYLGIGAISASDDSDIIDAVGYGADATYFQGNGPAPEISDNYFLNRSSWSGDNAVDFNLSPAEDPIAAAALAAASSDDSAPPTEEIEPTTELEDKDGLTLIRSDGLINLWHFDECYGEGSWAVGRWDCARAVGGYNDDFSAALDPAADLNDFSLALNYKKAGNSPRLTINLKNDEENRVIFTLESGLITVKGLPETEGRYYLDVPFGEEWHQAVLTVNWEKDYWAVYIDGEERIRESFMAALPIINALSAGGTAGAVLMDEVAVWNRPLSGTEIAFINNSAAPFSPLSPREAKIIPELKYHWNFSEGTGETALDNVSGATLDLPGGAWTARAHDNYALSTVYNKTYTADFSSALVSRDISLTFWWRNSAYPQEGRANIFLGNHIFSLLTNYYRPAYWFNNSYGIISQGADITIPNDDAWHHLAFVYDSHDYRLRFYVDGEETKAIPLIWWPPETAIQDLKITSDGQSSALDDLKIWRGALSAEQIREIYANN